MTACVIDASAVLAFLFGERGGDVAQVWLDRGAAMSTANVQEVVATLVGRGASLADAVATIDDLAVEVVDLTLADAIAAGGLIAITRPIGLSAGDRCCLALGRRLGVPVVHAERRWQPLAGAVGVEMVLIREPPAEGQDPIGR